MGELDTALEALAADDLFALPAPALLDLEAELLRARNRLDAELARTTRRAELAQAPEHDGQKTMASWLRGTATSPPGRPGCWSATAAPWPTCLPSPRAAPPG